MPYKIAVIGAGITGLTAAYECLSAGHEVAVFEEATEPGGLVSGFKVGNEILEKFYHHIFTGDNELIALCRELGLDGSIRWFEPLDAVYLNDRLHPFTSPMDLIRFTPLPFFSRIRTGLLALMSRFIRDYAPYDRVTAKEWLVKRAGKASYDKIWEPLLHSKFDSDAGNISGTWIWNKLKLRGKSRDKNLRREQLGYMDGGFSSLVSRLEEKITENGGVLNYGTGITQIDLDSDGRFTLDGNTAHGVFDKVLFTASPQILASIRSPLSAEYREKLAALKMKANLCMVLELKESLSPYYWITVAQQDVPFVLVIEHTRLVGVRGYQSHIVYLSRYVDASDSLYHMSDSEIASIFLSGLQKVFPGFDRSGIRNMALSRASYAQPVITKGYSEKIPALETPVDGLYLASMSQIYPEDRGMNHAVRLGLQAADLIRRS